jgi:4-amino-4-deoxy-L-arabinose transferase-like glycosyltransferase
VRSGLITEPPGAAGHLRALLTSSWFIVTVAFALRLENILAHHLYIIPAKNDHTLFGFELGRLARSIALGRGFSQVFDAGSGPTAWWTPGFPLLLGGVFKIFGVYSSKAALVILSLNSLFSALTCRTMFLIAIETLGRRTAILSAWTWAVLPYAIYWPTHHIWDTSLSALMVTLAILCTLRMDRSRALVHWAAFGLLWGVIALTNAVLLSFLPVALLWIWRTSLRGYGAYSRQLAVFAVAVVLVITPWVLRNKRVMGKFIFPRSNFGFELYMGNHGEGYNRGNFWGPIVNPVESEKYDKLGEIAYMADKQKLAVSFITQHPGVFVLCSLERTIFFWTTSPDEYWVMRGRNFPRMSLFLAITLTAIAGLYLANRNRLRGVLLLGGVLFFYALVYYITHVESRYYHPIAPVILMLAVYAAPELYQGLAIRLSAPK